MSATARICTSRTCKNVAEDPTKKLCDSCREKARNSQAKASQARYRRGQCQKCSNILEDLTKQCCPGCNEKKRKYDTSNRVAGRSKAGKYEEAATQTEPEGEIITLKKENVELKRKMSEFEICQVDLIRVRGIYEASQMDLEHSRVLLRVAEYEKSVALEERQQATDTNASLRIQYEQLQQRYEQLREQHNDVHMSSSTEYVDDKTRVGQNGGEDREDNDGEIATRQENVDSSRVPGQSSSGRPVTKRKASPTLASDSRTKRRVR